MSGVSSALAAIVVFLIGWGPKPAMFRASRPNLHAGGAKALYYSGETAPKQNKAFMKAGPHLGWRRLEISRRNFNCASRCVFAFAASDFRSWFPLLVAASDCRFANLDFRVLKSRRERSADAKGKARKDSTKFSSIPIILFSSTSGDFYLKKLISQVLSIARSVLFMR